MYRRGVGGWSIQGGLLQTRLCPCPPASSQDLAARGLIAHPKPAVAAHVLAAAKQQQ